MACLDPELKEALEEEEHRIQQQGTGHYFHAATFLSNAEASRRQQPAPAAAADHAFSLSTLLGLGQLHAPRPSDSLHAASPPPRLHVMEDLDKQRPPPHIPLQRQGAKDPGSPLRSSAVGRLLDQITLPPSAEEAVARALCDRLVEYVAYQHAISELSGITDDLESFQAEVFLSAFMSASMQAVGTSSVSPHSDPRLLPPPPSSSSNPSHTSTCTITRACSLPDTHASTPAAFLPEISLSNPQSRHHRTSATHLPATAPRPASVRPPRPGRNLPPIIKQASFPGTPLSAGCGSAAHEPGFEAVCPHTPQQQDLDSHASCPIIPYQLPQGLASVGQHTWQAASLPPPPPLPSSKATTLTSMPISSKQQLQECPSFQEQAQPSPHTLSQLSQHSCRSQRTRSASAAASGPLKPQQFVCLTAYMMHELGRMRPLRVVSPREWGGLASGGRAPGRRVSSGFCPALLERMGVMSRQQMDTVRAELRANVKSAAPAAALLVEPGAAQ